MTIEQHNHSAQEYLERLKKLPRQEVVTEQVRWHIRITNTIREKISRRGYWSPSSELLYRSIHNDHFPEEVPIQLMLMDPAVSSDLDDYNTRFTYTLDQRQGMLVPQEISTIRFRDIRKNELARMCRVDPTTGELSMMGVPAGLLQEQIYLDAEGELVRIPPVSSELFQKIDKYLSENQQKYNYDLWKKEYTPEQLAAGNPRFLHSDEPYRVLCAAATVLDFLHVYHDGNGRSSEDWMVEMQCRLFGSIDKVKTWTLHGIRSEAGLTALTKGNITLSEQFRQEYEETTQLLRSRELAILRFKEVVVSEFLQKLRSKKEALSKISEVRLQKVLLLIEQPHDKKKRDELMRELNILVISERETLREVLMEIIEGLHDETVRKKYKLDSSDGEIGVTDVLIDSRSEQYAYHVISPDDALVSTTPSPPSAV